jgi:GR25 family glycosyltransferase involved in LPS biosynthesis
MATKTKYYSSEQIQAKFNKLTKDKKIEVLYDAIDVMNQYNGRSRFLCIAIAMGYENHEGLSTTYTKR